MIPPFANSGVLPPYVGVSAADGAGVSPYRTTMTEIVRALATTPERVKLCRGMLDHRKALRGLGVVQAVQWINGSFCENVEQTRGRPPGDIDVVTLLARPADHVDNAAWAALVTSNLQIFDSAQAKTNFGCEAFFIDLNGPPEQTISQITYWFGLFTHQKVTQLWKGILQVPIASDDALADLQVTQMLTPQLLGTP